MGVFEFEKFANGTKAMMDDCVEATKKSVPSANYLFASFGLICIYFV